ncbi:MAG TPA: HAMP domain-containing sensor histidine kinase [Methyloceanibacter sp.]|nr:HAMP domain-containing sensor histidine kinase [Methyloceanibacter sp.]
MSFTSLRVRLLAGAAAFVLTALALAAVGLTFLFQNHMERWVDGELDAYLDQVIAGIDNGPNGQLMVAEPPADPRFEQPLSGRYWQVNVKPDGPALRSRSLWDYAIPLPTGDVIGDAVHRHRVPGPNGTRLYLLQRHITLPSRLGGNAATAAVAVDAAEVAAAVRRFATVLIPLLLLLAALLIGAAWIQVRVGLKPLSIMQRKLGDIRTGPRKRLGDGFPDEVQPLATEVDTLLDDRDRRVDSARARAADLAHALKTPLQVLLSDAEQLNCKGETEMAQEIEGIATVLQRHTERQLSRARMATYAANAAADMGEIAERVVRVMKRTPQGQRLAWRTDLPHGSVVRIDPQDFAEAIGNLTENAVRHARARIAITLSRDASTASVTIADDGPGIPAEHQEEVLRRGARLDSAGTGTGLGLAIVKDIAETWDATLSFETTSQGFSVRLSIPAAAEATVVPLAKA